MLILDAHIKPEHENTSFKPKRNPMECSFWRSNQKKKEVGKTSHYYTNFLINKPLTYQIPQMT